jgi:hypothetical protein
MPRKVLFAVLYLICIPLFAGIYYIWLPNSFYHSTVQFEYPTMNRAASGILDGIRHSLVKAIEGHAGAKACGSWRIDPGSINVSALDGREGKIAFTVSGQSTTEAPGHAEYYFSNRFSIALNQRMITNPPDGEATVYFLPTSESPAMPRMAPLGMIDVPACLFPPEGGYTSAFLSVSLKQSEEMRDFAVALRGFPSRIPGQFWRMLYFSATTITTLGFGDIVPLSTAARMVVSLESVLGIVLIGLFVNALSSEIKRKPTSPPGSSGP